jgi:uroporphyrinogen decarboxylase
MAYRNVLQDIRACIELRAPARMPVFALGLEFDMLWNGCSYHQYRSDVDVAVNGIVRAVKHFDYDWAMVFPDDYIEFEPLGIEMRDDPNLPAMAASYLPMTREMLQQFKLPDPARDLRLPIHLEMIRRVRAALGDNACVTGRIAAPFSALGLIYGIEPLMIQLNDDPGFVRDNLKFFVDHQIAFGKAQLDAGVHALWLGDCVASSKFLSPTYFSEFAADAAATVASELVRAGAIIIYHTNETSLPHLKLQAALPVSAVNVGEGVDIARVRNAIGPTRCLTGNFDPFLLRDGTPEQVTEAVAGMIRENRSQPGYIFNTGEGVMATTPPRNVEAMMRAAKAITALG